MARGDIFYEAWAEYPRADSYKSDQERRVHVAANWTREEAEAKLDEFVASQTARGMVPERGWIEEKRVETDFEIPPLPTPRDRYTVEAEPFTQPGEWTQVRVRVLRDGEPVARFDRNYSMLRTFEPFRQAGRDYALISPSYTGTSVMDLETGEVIAAEEVRGDGFCPVGFYVPDWHDVNYSSQIPSARYWDSDSEWPIGDFGFVWGCVWGDDTSWKVQHLDLSRITEGILVRDDRFGYVSLATDPKAHPKSFIEVERLGGKTEVRFRVELVFDLETGAAEAERYGAIHHEGESYQPRVWVNGRLSDGKDGG